MQDIVDQLLGYLIGIWNKRWYAMVIAWLVSLIGWGVVYQLPDKYEANAKIYIDTQSLLKPLLKGMAVESDIRTELNLMVRTLLTRPNVEKIIRLADLDLSVANETEFDNLVDVLQKNIKFKKASRSRVNLYDLSYINPQPEVAQRVIQSVITVFIESSIGRSKDDTDSARIFIQKQLSLYEKRLFEAENRLKLFKQKNVGMLPSETGDYYARLQQAKTAIKQVKLNLKEVDRAVIPLQKELNIIIDAAKNNTGGLIVTTYDKRIETLNSDLDHLLLSYTDSHPDVKSTKRVLKNLEDKRAVELETIRSSGSSGSGLELNPVYQDLKYNIGSMKSQKSALNVRLVEFQKRYDNLVKLVDHIPEIEAQLTALNRDYGITKNKYEELLARKESASLSENITKSTDGVQFNVVDPPRVGNEPVGPKRILLSSVVLLFSLAAGIAFSFVLSQIKSVFNSARNLKL